MMKTRYACLIFGWLLVLGCGEKAGPELVVSLTSSAGFTDANSFDVVMIAENIPTSDGMLDLDGDGIPDTFAYPEACSASLAPQCGIPVTSSGTFNIGNLPLNYTFSLQARIRDSAGTTLYQGSTTMVNNGSPQNLAIILSAVTP